MTRPAAKPLGLYVHIPFCRQKCSYCDFYSLPHSEEKMDAYTAALVRHLEEVAPQAAAHVVDTVYIGGGTPTYLGAARLKTILTAIRKRYRLSHDAEITVEANPDSACDVKALRTLHRAGVNRVSLGVQSALKSAGYNTADKPMPIVTGQDANLPNVKAIISGEQSMSVFKDTRALADQVVKMVDAIINGKEPEVNDTKSYNNGTKVVPSYLLQPQFVDKSNYQKLLLDSGYYKADDLKK